MATNKRRLGGTHPTAEERLVSEESAGRTPKAARRARPASLSAASSTKMHARGVRISNIVCFAVIDCDIDLRMLAIAIGARFDKGIFPSAVVWLHGTTATLSIFKKRGVFKVVIAGAYTESDARAAVHRVAFAIHCRFGVAASVKNFKVNNVVGSASLGFRVNLAACYKENQDLCNYNPTNFSGLQYRYWQKRRMVVADEETVRRQKRQRLLQEKQVGGGGDDNGTDTSGAEGDENDEEEDGDDDAEEEQPTISFAVFESGKMVLTGAREFQDLVDAFEASKHVFFQYRVKPN